ncbi:thymidylate synthase [Leisingera aquaemixtae]|uniref:thymidylate synthase n=1 Tax=Leisingera aquaemixtae TaxID=1396826 RepID=UPI0021A31A86|nr:thymidylate synthase [Leisingera aquaemixtae]UWQ47002.1 thymidylate synthase [Leisingera aquaemixtae]
MRRFWLGIAAAAALSACGGGNPFTTGTGDPDDVTGTIPEAIANDLDSVSYNPASQTLTVTGVSLDETPFSATYVRKPSLDRDGYEAYTVQDSSLDRHSTAYAREIEGGYAVVVATGGQFGYYFAGANYGRSGAYSAPATDQPSGGLVSYAGSYIGLLNVAGSGEDLLPVTPGTPTDVLPTQAAEITGDVLINADFTDNAVNGLIYNRAVRDDGSVSPTNLELAPTAIASDGTFSGLATINQQSVGEYGGVFSGTNAASVAGGVHATGHITEYGPEIEEYGVFVLGQCGGASSDPLCDQPTP